MKNKPDSEWQKLMNAHYGGSNNKYIGRQHKNENESTKALMKFIEESIPKESNFKILDAGCGDGGMLLSTREKFPNAKLSGFDMAKDMISYAKSNLPQDIKVGYGDLFDIPSFSEEKFDVIYTVHTLPLFDEFEPLIDSLMEAASQHIFINSLFSKFNVDMISTVREQEKPEVTWACYSMNRFEQYVLDQGANNVEFREFNMPLELPDTNKGMGSYTRKLEDGALISFSGPLYLPWYFVRIDL